VLVVDRTVSWDKDQEFGAHAETAIERTSDVWYLAEGATQAGFDLFYLIQNPNPQTERVEVTYLLAGRRADRQDVRRPGEEPVHDLGRHRVAGARLDRRVGGDPLRCRAGRSSSSGRCT
jgi:hypothetical protein